MLKNLVFICWIYLLLLLSYFNLILFYIYTNLHFIIFFVIVVDIVCLCMCVWLCNLILFRSDFFSSLSLDFCWILYDMPNGTTTFCLFFFFLLIYIYILPLVPIVMMMMMLWWYMHIDKYRRPYLTLNICDLSLLLLIDFTFCCILNNSLFFNFSLQFSKAL